MKRIIALLLLLIGTMAFSQTEPQHKFFDWENKALIAPSMVAITGQSLSGQRAWAFNNPHLAAFVPNGNTCADPIFFIGNEALCHIPARKDATPFARLFGSSRLGQATAGASLFGMELGGMYVAHRLERHHGRFWGWVERAIPVAVTGIELNYTRMNYANVRSLPESIKRPTASNH